MSDPYAAPKADLQMESVNTDYNLAGFWIRVGASIIDTILMMLVIMPLLFLFYGPQVFDPDYQEYGTMSIIIQYLMPFVAVMLFWVYRSATPGKIMLNLKIVDADSGQKPPTAKFLVRYVGYYVSMLALCIGFIWVAFDKRKQGWHDKMSNTIVIRE